MAYKARPHRLAPSVLRTMSPPVTSARPTTSNVSQHLRISRLSVIAPAWRGVAGGGDKV